MFLPLLLVVIFCVLGVLTGVITGLLPGLHVNNIALILLSMSGGIVGACAFLLDQGISASFILLLISVFIVSNAIAHTFHDVIPTTFLGAPDEDSALSVLPAHSLLLEGRGYEAVALSALGSYGAIVLCFLLLVPIKLIIGKPLLLYETLQNIMPWVLIAIAILMIATEKGRVSFFGSLDISPALGGMVFASFVFFLSGVFGLIVLDFPVYSPIGFSAPVLFPALAGLFGTPTLLTSLMTQPAIKKQMIEPLRFKKGERKNSVLSIATGSLAGILVSIIPGITSATGTILAMTARGENDRRQTIITLSAVNTACAFFVVVVLFIILRPRSGAALAVNQLLSVSEWNALMMPTTLIYLLMALLLAGGLSYLLTIKIGKLFAQRFSTIPYTSLIKGTIFMIVVLVLLFTGLSGLLILIVATFTGLIPIHWGVRRSHCMGILLIPIILHFL